MRGGLFVSDDNYIIKMRVNDFNEKTVTVLSNKLHAAIRNGQQVFPIEIDSVGGDAYALFAIVDLLETAKPLIKIATVCSGKAFSAGAFLLACGSKGLRFAGPNSSIMLHQVQGGVVGTIEDMKVDMKESRRVNRGVLKILGKATGKGSAFFEAKLKGNCDLYLTPTEAKRFGMIDRIHAPMFFPQSEQTIVVA